MSPPFLWTSRPRGAAVQARRRGDSTTELGGRSLQKRGRPVDCLALPTQSLFGPIRVGMADADSVTLERKKRVGRALVRGGFCFSQSASAAPLLGFRECAVVAMDR
jgi:hypothetical protein